MAGKQCVGEKQGNAAILNQSRAYCEGRQAAADGALIGSNPHPNASEAGQAWDLGYTSWTANPDGPLAPATIKDCCAQPYGGGFVAPP